MKKHIKRVCKKDEKFLNFVILHSKMGEQVNKCGVMRKITQKTLKKQTKVEKE